MSCADQTQINIALAFSCLLGSAKSGIFILLTLYFCSYFPNNIDSLAISSQYIFMISFQQNSLCPMKPLKFHCSSILWHSILFSYTGHEMTFCVKKVYGKKQTTSVQTNHRLKKHGLKLFLLGGRGCELILIR